MKNFIGKITAALAVAVLGAGLVGTPAAAVAAPKPKPPAVMKKGSPPVAGQISTMSACPGCYRYASGQVGGTTGITATRSTSRIAKPFLDSVDSHSLAETAIQGGSAGGAGSNNIVEVGWTVDRGLNGGSADPHLFVFAWYDNAGVRTPCDYNGRSPNICGYVDKASNPVDAGDSINADLGTEPSFEIYHYAPSSAWIINYKGLEVGRYPDSLLHSSSFTSANLVQNFGELAIAHDPSCTDMGNSNFPTSGSTYPGHGAEFKSLNLAYGGSYSAGAYTTTVVTSPSNWDALLVGTDQLRYGGKGAGSPTTVPSPCP